MWICGKEINKSIMSRRREKMFFLRAYGGIRNRGASRGIEEVCERQHSGVTVEWSERSGITVE